MIEIYWFLLISFYFKNRENFIERKVYKKNKLINNLIKIFLQIEIWLYGEYKGVGRMKVLFGTKFSAQSYILDYYKKFSSPDINFIIPDSYDEKILIELAADVDVLIKDSVSIVLLEHAKNLKHIQIPWTGSDRMNFELLKEYPNITISNSHSNSLIIAEHAVALLLAVAKQISYRDTHMRKGDWIPRSEPKLESLLLTGKTAGIIGYGAIGQKTPRM